VAGFQFITTLHGVKAITGRCHIRNLLPRHLRQALGTYASASNLSFVSLHDNQRSCFSFDDEGGALDPDLQLIPWPWLGALREA
jgi:hypothetical protein